MVSKLLCFKAWVRFVRCSMYSTWLAETVKQTSFVWLLCPHGCQESIVSTSLNKKREVEKTAFIPARFYFSSQREHRLRLARCSTQPSSTQSTSVSLNVTKGRLLIKNTALIVVFTTNFYSKPFCGHGSIISFILLFFPASVAKMLWIYLSCLKRRKA